MSFVQYSNLHSPNEVLAVISAYVTSCGYTVVADCVDDLNIYDQADVDGKKLVFRSRNSNYFYLLRTANGNNIFGHTDELEMGSEPKQSSRYINGIGVTISEGYSPVARWYNQGSVPLTYKKTDVLGCFMPVATEGSDGPTGYTYTLFCNNITNNDADTLVFTLMKEYDTFRQCAHIILGQLMPYGQWTGGAFFSASATRTMLDTCWQCFEHKMDADKWILPVLCSGYESNTFLRLDIDAAPTAPRGLVIWSSSGSLNETGKRLSLPIRLEAPPRSQPSWVTNGKIPNYYLLQSSSMFDWGRDVNTLNCLTINLPIYFAVQIDPDGLEVYSSAGQILGVYFVCMLNMQTSYTYKLNYPSNIDVCQVFPMGKRRGKYGFDGISVKQEGEVHDPTDPPPPPIIPDPPVIPDPPNYVKLGMWAYPVNSSGVFDIVNNTTGIRAFSGKTKVWSLTNTYGTDIGELFLLGNGLTDNYIIYFTDTNGNSLYSVEWGRSDLLNASSGANLFKNSTYRWIISSVSLSNDNNINIKTNGDIVGGLVGIAGMVDSNIHPNVADSWVWPLESTIQV